jgi:hypothetical protein
MGERLSFIIRLFDKSKTIKQSVFCEDGASGTRIVAFEDRPSNSMPETCCRSVHPTNEHMLIHSKEDECSGGCVLDNGGGGGPAGFESHRDASGASA